MTTHRAALPWASAAGPPRNERDADRGTDNPGAAADNQGEDPDPYRVLHDSTAQIVAGRRTPVRPVRPRHQAARRPDVTIVDQRPSRAWLTDNAHPADTGPHAGIDWSPTHRILASHRARPGAVDDAATEV